LERPVNRILKHEHCTIEIKNAKKIIGTRNKISHEYDSISDEIIWTVIMRELPELEKEIIDLIKQY